MSQSPLSTYTKLSPSFRYMSNKVNTGVAIHCSGGSKNSTGKDIVDYGYRAGVSFQYAIGGDGSIATGCLEISLIPEGNFLTRTYNSSGGYNPPTLFNCKPIGFRYDQSGTSWIPSSTSSNPAIFRIGG